MPGKPGEISARKAAALLDVNVKTMLRWARSAARHEDGRLPPGSARQVASGRYYVQLNAIVEIKREFGLA